MAVPALRNGPGGIRRRSPDEILALQRCAGNGAVAEALQRPATARPLVQRNGNPFGSATPSPDERGKKPKPEQWVEMQEMGTPAPSTPKKEESSPRELEAEADLGVATVSYSQGEKGRSGGVKAGGTEYGYDEKKGAYVKGMSLFKGGPTVDFSANQQKVSYSVPGTDWSFPPPKGEWTGPAFKAQIPAGPHPFGIEVGGKITGGVKLSKLAFSAEHKRDGEATDPVVTNTATFTGKTSIKATLGGNFDLGVWGGVPQVATVSAGGRLSPSVEAQIGGTITGQFMQKHTNPEPGVEPTELDRKGQIDFTMTGSGVLTGAIKAYLSGQILMHEHDFFELTIASADIAKIEAGARLGRRWDGLGAEGENIREKVGDDWVNISFLLQDALRARKVDRAKLAAVRAKADVAAYEDIQQFLATGSRKMALPGEVAVLRRQADELTEAWKAADDAIAQSAKDLETVEMLMGVSSDGGTAQIQVGEDMVKLTERRRQLLEARAAALKRRTKKERELLAVNQRTSVEWAKFYKNLDLDRIEDALAKAKAAESTATERLLVIYREKVNELVNQSSKKMDEFKDEMKRLRQQMKLLEAKIETESRAAEKASYEKALASLSEDYDKLTAKHELAEKSFRESRDKLEKEFGELVA